MSGWDNLRRDAQKASGRINYVKLKEGDNRIRLLQVPLTIYKHRIETPAGVRNIVCPKLAGKGKCPACEFVDKLPRETKEDKKMYNDFRAKTRFVANVLNRESGMVEVLEGGPTIFEAIAGFESDPEYGDPLEYDITIKRSGTGLGTKYQVVPSPKKIPLTEEEKRVVAEDSVDLKQYVAPRSYKDIEIILAGGDPGSSEDIDPEEVEEGLKKASEKAKK